jgi:hypothetical protein
MYISLQEALIAFPEAREILKSKAPELKDDYVQMSQERRALCHWAPELRHDTVKDYVYTKIACLKKELENLEKTVAQYEFYVKNSIRTREVLDVDKARNTPLIEVIRRHYPHIHGRTTRGKHTIKCPFHNDKNPSCSVNDTVYYCFSCGAGGDTIKFVMDIDKCDFVTAVKKICA